MTGVMHTISGMLPSAIPGIADPWLGTRDLGAQLAVCAVWSAPALTAIYMLVRSPRSDRDR